MPFSWNTDDGVTVTSTVIQATVGATTGPFTPSIPSDQAYRIMVEFGGFLPDPITRGPFALAANTKAGDNFITVAAGVGANFAASDVIVLDNGLAGEDNRTQVTQVDPSYTGGDTIPLRERSRLDLPSGSATVTIPPTMSIAGTEGGSSKTEGPYALTDNTLVKGLYPSRLRWDPGTTVTITLVGFDASTTITVYTYIDPWNIYVSDRTTRRSIFAATAPTVPIGPNAFLHSWVNDGGGTTSFSGLANGNVDRYKNTGTPVRVYVDVTAGTNFSGGVNISGCVTRAFLAASIGVGATSCRIYLDQYEQLHVGDVVTLVNYSTGGVETQTIASKTAPDTLNFSGSTINAYNKDDLICLAILENISVAAGIGGGSGPAGEYVSASSYVEIFEISTAGGTEDFTYEVFSSTQGHCGALTAASPRQGSGIASTGAVQCEPNVQIATRITVGDGVSRMFFGGAGGLLVTPRNHDALIDGASTNSVLYFGMRDHVSRQATSPFIWMRGSSAAGSDGWSIKGSTTNGVIAIGLVAMNRKLVAGADAGRNEVLDPAFWVMLDTLVYTRNIYRQGTTDAFATRVRSAIEVAGGLFASGSGADYQINAPTDVFTFENVASTNAYARAFSSIPSISFPLGSPIRINGLNNVGGNAAGSASRRISLLGTNRTHESRAISCYFSEIELQGNSAATKRLTSAILFRVQVIDETGEPIEGVQIQLITVTGTVVVDSTTDVFGRIPRQEVVTHQWDSVNTPVTSIWRVGDPPPTEITETVFGPFLLLITPSGTTGLVPYQIQLDPLPLFPNNLDLLVVMHAPRSVGKYGQAPYGSI